MQIIKKELTRNLQLIKPGQAKKEIVEQTGSYLSKAEHLITYNDEICLSVHFRVGFEGAVAGEKFYKAIRSAPTETVDITADKGRVFVRSGEMVTEMEVAEIILPLENVPRHEPDDWVSLAPDFKEKSKLAAGAASKNLARPVLCCIHMRDNIIEATDNYRIIRCRTAASLPAGIDLLIPKNSMLSLLKMNPAALAYANGWVSFKTAEDVCFSCRVLDATFPNTEPNFTQGWEGPINFQHGNLAEILDRATHFAEENCLGDPIVDISAIDDLLMVEAGQEDARFRETCKIDFRGKLKFHANPLLLKDAFAMKFDKACFSRNGKRIDIKFENESVTYLLVCRSADETISDSFN
ncbi:MAG: hypothetical protein ABSH41_30430 [Syntrophobacteraceae bacterium]|jgi:DNA polymerase III sliding clamp (beta) subunit (PCNA family)